MKWVELKMGQLGVLNNPNYKIAALLDHMAMITVQSDTRGVFDCKPLDLIWSHFPEVWILHMPFLMFYCENYAGKSESLMNIVLFLPIPTKAWI